MNRIIMLKAIEYRATRKPDFVPPQIHTTLHNIWNGSQAIQDIVYEYGAPGSPHHRVCFMNHGVRTRQGFAFQFCSYSPGEYPPSMGPDLTVRNVDVEAIPVTDARGNQRHVVHAVNVLVYGRVMIIENAKGAGGVSLLQRYLTYLLRNNVDEDHPSLNLHDAVSANIHDEISAAGGAVGVTMKLVHANNLDGSVYADSLSNVRSAIGGTDMLTVKWTSDTRLSSEQVEAAFLEAEENDALDGITINLRNGDTLNLGKHKIRDSVSVDEQPGRNPNRDQLMRHMKRFLLELMRPDDNGNSVLSQQGELIRGRLA